MSEYFKVFVIPIDSIIYYALKHFKQMADMRYQVYLPPEILLRIFANLGAASNANNARVCRAWSEPALDLVWHTLYDWTAPLAVLVGTTPLEGHTTFRRQKKVSISISQKAVDCLC